MSKLIITLSALYIIACTPSGAEDTKAFKEDTVKSAPTAQTPPVVLKQNSQKVIHVFVALCDNKYQGIVPVPAGIGNGQNENTNLYWGCGYGVRTYFKNSTSWKFITATKNPKTHVLERCVFKHKKTGTIMVADAYDGEFMDETLLGFFQAGAGYPGDSVMVDSSYYYTSGSAELVAFVGHNGLLDHPLYDTFSRKDTLTRQAIMLCCAATANFTPYLETAGMHPLLWTTNLMAPEAYTLHDAIETWLNGGDGKAVEMAAATAYNKYQKCGMRGALNLFDTGF